MTKLRYAPVFDDLDLRRAFEHGFDHHRIDGVLAGGDAGGGHADLGSTC